MSAAVKRLAYRAAAPAVHAGRSLLRADHTGAKCLVTRGGELLLVRHTYGDRRRWELPGGSVRRRERPIAAAAREIREELGVGFEAAELTALGVLVQSRRRRLDTVHYFHAQLAAGTPIDPDEGELAAVAWFSPAYLPGRLGDHVAELASRFGEGRA